MNRFLKLVVFLLAAIYFLVDAIFLTVAKSLANWIAEHWIFESLRAWIVSLPPYSTLALFALPLAILEPVKPMAAYFVGTGHVATGLILLVVGEILKLLCWSSVFLASYNFSIALGWQPIRTNLHKLTNLRNFTNLRNIRSPDVVSADRHSHDARIVRPESERRGCPSQIHGVRRSNDHP